MQPWDKACPQCLTRLAPEANCNERNRAMKLNGGAVDEPCTTLVRTAIRSRPTMLRDCLAEPTALHLLHHRLTPKLSRAERGLSEADHSAAEVSHEEATKRRRLERLVRR